METAGRRGRRPLQRRRRHGHGIAQTGTNPPAGLRLQQPQRLFRHHLHAEQKRILSFIAVGEGLAPPETFLSAIGKLVEEQILDLPIRYPSVSVDNHVIMPNHIHLIVSLAETAGGASPSPTAWSGVFASIGGSSPSLFDVVRVLKSLTTRLASPLLGESPLWQRSYHEHVIRGGEDYLQIWVYIDTNPFKWEEDRYYTP